MKSMGGGKLYVGFLILASWIFCQVRDVFWSNAVILSPRAVL